MYACVGQVAEDIVVRAAAAVAAEWPQHQRVHLSLRLRHSHRPGTTLPQQLMGNYTSCYYCLFLGGAVAVKETVIKETHGTVSLVYEQEAFGS